MDHIVEILVRLSAFGARFAKQLPTLELAHWQPGDKLKVLLVGYNGARNTGADVRVATMVQQLKQSLGNDLELSLITLDEDSMLPYIDSDTHLIKLTTNFFQTLQKACSENHVIIIGEGSMLKSKFANGLTLFMCEAAAVAKAQNKPCVAYGVEAGQMDDFIAAAAQDMCSDTYFIARTQQSLDVITGLGLEGHLGTDTAWPFQNGTGTERATSWLKQNGWDGKAPLLGIAAINPFCWPARPSLPKLLRSKITGDKSMHYSGLYFLSWSEQRKQAFENYISALAQAVAQRVRETGSFPVLIGMEKLDADACGTLSGKLAMPHAKMLARDNDGYIISGLLEKLDVLVTSRYHAAVLAFKELVPCVAVSMDERLNNLFSEAQMDSEFLLDVNDINLADEITRALQTADQKREELTKQLCAYREERLKMCDEMAQFLRTYLSKTLPGWTPQGA